MSVCFDNTADDKRKTKIVTHDHLPLLTRDTGIVQQCYYFWLIKYAVQFLSG